MKYALLASVAVCIVGFVAFSVLRNPARPCDDGAVLDVVRQIMTQQLGVTGTPALRNIRVIAGGAFDRRYECQAEANGIDEPSLFGVAITQVRYTSEVTEDTRRIYVTARMVTAAP